MIDDIIPPNAILLICNIFCAKVGFKLKYNPELVKTKAAASEAEIKDNIAGGNDGLFK
jgi:hypothetical protein